MLYLDLIPIDVNKQIHKYLINDCLIRIKTLKDRTEASLIDEKKIVSQIFKNQGMSDEYIKVFVNFIKMELLFLLTYFPKNDKYVSRIIYFYDEIASAGGIMDRLITLRTSMLNKNKCVREISHIINQINNL